jgi:hypothetical protein
VVLPPVQVRGSVGEEQGAAGGKLDRDGPLLGRKAADVVVTVGIPGVLELLAERAGNDPHGAVGDRGVVNGRPQRRALERVLDLKVRIVLVPVGSGAALARFRNT